MSDYSSKAHHNVGGDGFTIEAGGVLTLGLATITINASGRAIVAGLPTADPHVAGELWSNSGVLTISAG